MELTDIGKAFRGIKNDIKRFEADAAAILDATDAAMTPLQDNIIASRQAIETGLDKTNALVHTIEDFQQSLSTIARQRISSTPAPEVVSVEAPGEGETPRLESANKLML